MADGKQEAIGRAVRAGLGLRLKKALPLGELAGASPTERARMLAGTGSRGDSIALAKGLLIAVSRLSGDGLALSVIASQCHLSQRERLWQSPQSERFRQRLPY